MAARLDAVRVVSTRTRWTVALSVAWLPFLGALGFSIWKTPFPVNETVALLEDIQTSHSSAFDPTARAWYRPLYFKTWEWLWHGSGSLDTALSLFKLIEVAAPLLLVLLFIWHLRPRTRLDAAAATCAVAVLVAMPGFRDNLEVPLLMTLVGMPLAMLTWMLLTREPRPWHAPLVVLLCLTAIGFKEQGLVIAPVVVVAWWTRAPGAGNRLTATVVALTLGYLAFRFAWSGNWPIFEQSMGLGFRAIEPREALARFGSFPYGMYVYNALATILNILIAEPTSGLFFIARDVAYNQVEPWEVVHLISSVTLTATMVWWSLRVMPGVGRGGWTPESRAALVCWMSVLACGALSIRYSRDRLGGMAVMFYALAAYEALRFLGARALDTARGASARRFCLTVSLLVVLALTWQVRAVGTLEWTRRQSELNTIGWLTQMPQRRVKFADRPVYTGIMSRMMPQGLAADASRHTNYPTFLRRLLGPQPE